VETRATKERDDLSERDDLPESLVGCLLGLMFFVSVTLAVSFVFTTCLGILSAKTEKIVATFVFLISVGIAGYVAARKRTKTWWNNSLLVGLIALIYIYGQFPRPAEMTGIEFLQEILLNPVANWRVLVLLLLTPPFAFCGGLLRVRLADRTNEKE
jgi:hypothetical protein